MLYKSTAVLFLTSCIYSTSLFGLSLKDSIVESINTNPIIDERLRNYRATQQDLSIAESEYYPKLDFRAVVGRNDAGEIKDYTNDKEYKHTVVDQTYNNYETSLTLTQNLFDGFGTMHKVDFEENRILAAAYNYVEKYNDIAFRMTSSYINVLRANELLQTAKENIQINEVIYNKVKSLLKSGLTTDSEVKKIQSSLALARSNYSVQLNNIKDSKYSFKRVLGRFPNIQEMQKPEINIDMPKSIESAALYAIKNNPSLLVSRYNVKGAQVLMKQRKKAYYPKVDLEVSQFYNDVDKRNSFDTPDDRFRARIVLNYNIFNGGADKANVQKHISKINQEIAIKRDLKRQVIEGIELSWDAYEIISIQLVDLKEFKVFSEDTLALYQDEYDLGRRSLLDLLSAQNDVINARSQIITAEYELLFAKYRILDAMGLLVVSVVGETKDLAANVNLYNKENVTDILDVIPAKLDVDNDNIADSIDLCDNSSLDNNIMPYGCMKNIFDFDNDGVSDEDDKCLYTPKGVRVSSEGCALDVDGDGVKDYEDKCLDTIEGTEIDATGCKNRLEEEGL